MNDRRRGLGRGLGALIPTAPTAEGDEDRAALSSFTGAPRTAPPQRVPAPEDGRQAAPANAVTGEVTDAPGERHASVSRETAGADAPVERNGAAGAGGSNGSQSTTGLGEVEGAYFAELPLDSITPNPHQPREVFDEDAMNELVHSIKEIGLLQPIVVRRSGPEKYELIMGERRWRASRLAGVGTIPAIIRQTEDDRMLLDALLENLHRSELNALEEAAAYDQLLKDFSCTHEELAERIGRSRSQVTNTLRLLKLPPAVQRRVAAGVLSAGHARALLSLDDSAEQERLANRIVAEGLSVRAAEEIVSMGQETKAPRKPRAGKRISPALGELADRLSDRFETRVKIELGQKRGRVVVDFASVEDLHRIIAVMTPDSD